MRLIVATVLIVLSLAAVQECVQSRPSGVKPTIFIPPLIPLISNNLSVLIPPSTGLRRGAYVAVSFRLSNFLTTSEVVVAEERVRVGVPQTISLTPKIFQSSYSLRVNSSELSYDQTFHPAGDSGVEVIVETNKFVFQPAETVKVRVIAVRKAGRQLIAGNYLIALKDPNGLSIRTVTAKWPVSQREFLRRSFGLPSDAQAGRWTIAASTDTSNASTSRIAVEIPILVRSYSLATFSLQLSASTPYLLSNVTHHSVTIYVAARYIHGFHKRLPRMIVEIECLGKKTKSVASGDQPHNETLEMDITEGTSVALVEVNVRDFQSGETVSSGLQIPVVVSPYKILFRPLKPYLGPNYVFQVHLLMADGSPQSNVPLVVRTTLVKQPSLSPTDDGYGRPLRQDLTDKLVNSGADGKVLVELKGIAPYMEVAFISISTSDMTLTAAQQANISVVVPSGVQNSIYYVSVTLSSYQLTRGDYLLGKVTKSDGIDSVFLIIRCGTTLITHMEVATPGTIKHRIDRVEDSKCDLMAYSVVDNQTVAFDVVEFDVLVECNGNVSTTKSVYHPGETVTVTVKNSANGIVGLKAIDKRLRSSDQRVHRGVQIPSLAADFIPKLLREKDSCSAAGGLYLRLYRTSVCLEPATVDNAIIDGCGYRMVQGCSQLQLAAAAPVAGSAQPGQSITFGGDLVSDEREMSTAAVPQRQPLDLPGAFQLRHQFEDSWLFEDIFSQSQDPVAFEAQMPHSLSTWSVRSTFWSPEEGICSGSPWDISTDKNIFLDVNVPDIVSVNEQVQLKVLVHTDSTISSKVYDLCQEVPPQVCVARSLAEDSGKSVTPLLVTSNGVTVATFFLEFLEPGSYPIKFFLLEQKGVVTETRSCADRRSVVDAVSKQIFVQFSKPLGSALWTASQSGLKGEKRLTPSVNVDLIITVQNRDKPQTSRLVAVVNMESRSAALNVSNEMLSLRRIPTSTGTDELPFQLEISVPIHIRPTSLQLSMSGDLIPVSEIAAVRELVESYYSGAATTQKSVLSNEGVLAVLLEKMIVFRLAAVHLTTTSLKDSRTDPNLPQVHLFTDAVERGYSRTQKFLNLDGSYSTFVKGGQPTLWLTLLVTDQLCQVGFQSVCATLQWILQLQDLDGSFFFSPDMSQFTIWSDKTEYRQFVTATTLMTLNSCESAAADCSDVSAKIAEGKMKAVDYLTQQLNKNTLGLLPLSLTTYVMASVDGTRAQLFNAELLKNRMTTDSFILWNYEAPAVSQSFWQKSWQKLKSMFGSKKVDRARETKNFALNGLALWSQLALRNPQRDLPLIKSFQWLVNGWRQADQQLLDTWACLGAMVSFTQSQLILSNVSATVKCLKDCSPSDLPLKLLPSTSNLVDSAQVELDLSPSVSSYRVALRGNGLARVILTLTYLTAPSVSASYSDQVNLTASLPLTDEEFVNLTVCVHFNETTEESAGPTTQYKMVIETLTGFVPEMDRIGMTEGNGHIVDVYQPFAKSLELQLIKLSHNTSNCLVVPFTTATVVSNQPLASVQLLDESGATLARTAYSDGNVVPLIQRFCDAHQTHCRCSPSVCVKSCAAHYNNSVLTKSLCDSNNTFAMLIMTRSTQSYASRGIELMTVRVETVFTSTNHWSEPVQPGFEFVFVQKSGCDCPVPRRRLFYLFIGNRNKFFPHLQSGKFGYLLEQTEILQRWSTEDLQLDVDLGERRSNGNRLWLYRWKELVEDSLNPCALPKIGAGR